MTLLATIIGGARQDTERIVCEFSVNIRAGHRTGRRLLTTDSGHSGVRFIPYVVLGPWKEAAQ
jgi:hypothetical protein